MAGSVLLWHSATLVAGELAPKVYIGPNNGEWTDVVNWEPAGLPALTNALFITNATVRVATEGLAGSLLLNGGALIIAGARSTSQPAFCPLALHLSTSSLPAPATAPGMSRVTGPPPVCRR